MSDSQKRSPKSTHIRLLIEKVRGSDASTRVPYVRELVDSMRGILSTSDEDVAAQFLFLEFVKEKVDDLCGEKLPPNIVDTFLDVLLEIANHNPSDEAALAVTVLFQLILKSEDFSTRFKPTKSNLFKLSLPLYIQAGDPTMRRNSIDLALFLLSNYDNIDMTDITTNPSVVSRISWVARRQGLERAYQQEQKTKQLEDALAQQKALFAKSQEMFQHLELRMEALETEKEALRMESRAKDVQIEEAKRRMDKMREEVNKHTGKIKELEDFSRVTRSSVDEQSVLSGLHHKRIEALEQDDQSSKERLRSIEGSLSGLSTTAPAHGDRIYALEGEQKKATERLDEVSHLLSKTAETLRKREAEVDIVIDSFANLEKGYPDAEAGVLSVASLLNRFQKLHTTSRIDTDALRGSMQSALSDLKKDLLNLQLGLKKTIPRIDRQEETFGNGMRELQAKVESLRLNLQEAKQAFDQQTVAVSRIAEDTKAVEGLKKLQGLVAEGVVQLRNESALMADSWKKLSQTTRAHQEEIEKNTAGNVRLLLQQELLKDSVRRLQIAVDETMEAPARLQELERKIREAVDEENKHLGSLQIQQEALFKQVHEFISKNDKAVEEIRKAMDENEAHSVRASQTLLVQLADMRRSQKRFREVSEELSGASSLIGSTVKRLEDMAGTHAMKLTELSKTTKKQEDEVTMVKEAVVTQQKRMEEEHEKIVSTKRTLDDARASISGITMAMRSEFAEKLRIVADPNQSVSLKVGQLKWMVERTNWFDPEGVSGAVDVFCEWVDKFGEGKRIPTDQELVTHIINTIRTKPRDEVIILLHILRANLFNDENMIHFVRSGGYETILEALSKLDRMRLVSALKCIYVTARNSAAILKFRQADGLRIVVGYLQHESREVVEWAAAVVRRCTRADDAIPDLQRLHALEDLIGLLKGSNPIILEHAAAALRNSARLGSSIEIIDNAGGFPLLFEVARGTTHPEVWNCAAGALRACAKNQIAFRRLQRLGALDYIYGPFPQVPLAGGSIAQDADEKLDG